MGEHPLTFVYRIGYLIYPQKSVRQMKKNVDKMIKDWYNTLSNQGE